MQHSLPAVVQAGMGGGLAGAPLAAAVADAGGLGTIGILAPPALRRELAAVRGLTGGTVAVNLIVPLARPEHWRIAAEADAIVTHWDRRPKRRAGNLWLATVGSAEGARAAVAAGADGVIAQGVESGGHVLGKVRSLELLERVRAAVGDRCPVWLAGGIATAADVRAALDAGAAGAVAGTRFLATQESGAHRAYKQRLIDDDATLLTELFGMGWPRAPHRVLANAATRKWLADGERGPASIRALHTAFGPVARRTPLALQMRLAPRAKSGPLDLSPAAPTVGMPAETIETHPLYAGETVARIDDILPAAQVVRDLSP